MDASLVSDIENSVANTNRKSVAFVTRSIPHYRVDFLNKLENRLKAAAIGLTTFADYVSPHTYHADGLPEVPCAIGVPSYYFGLRKILGKHYERTSGNSLRPPYWQPIFRRLLTFDLVIVEQSNSALLNYPLILHRQLADSPRIAFWGHGENLQATRKGLRHGIKRAMTHHADHWFVYSELSAGIMRKLGVDDDIITVVNNSVDTSVVRSTCAIDPAAKVSKKAELGLDSTPVAIFCARLTGNKALPFLVDACRAARERFGEFTLLVIGDGHYGPWLRQQAESEAWIRPLGPLYDEEKAAALAAADVFLLPSANGLSILDSFAAGLPILSANFGNHGPEIAYLKNDVNGLMTDATIESYSDAIVRVLSDDGLRKSLSAGARRSADIFTVDAMVDNFAQGVEQALV